MNPGVTYKSDGILGMSPTGRTRLRPYGQYLAQSGLIGSNSFTLEQHLVGSVSNLTFGRFDTKLHLLNYTLTTPNISATFP